MSGNDDAPLLSAAGQISKGVPVDWSKLQDQVSTPDEQAVAEELRSLERFAQISEAMPATWGRFQIVSEIGRGTFGTVYCAVDPTLRLEIALKVIRSRTPGLPIDHEKALDEARRLVKVQHPNVVRAYGAELIDNEVGLSMELVKGQTLDEIVRRQATFSANEATVIGIDLCRALAAVHRADILHGDIKAHNVMREQGGRTVLMDFGTGRPLRQEPVRPGSDFAGTPLYIAPEVFAGRSRTPTSEIYSLGVLLYFMVSGSYPVEGESRTTIERLHGESTKRRSLRDARPDLPDTFIRVVERATADSPDQRYQTAGELEAALRHVFSPPIQQAPGTVHDSSRTWRRLAVLAASLVVIVTAWIAAYRMLTRPTAPETAAVASGSETAIANTPATGTASAAPYRIESAFYRETSGRIERLRPGASLAPGDALSLQVQTSIPMYVYIVNEDEQGESYLLFPLPGYAVQNPLPAGQRHRLPTMQDGELMSWQVTTTGQREHFLIVASPERSTRFDEVFASLPRPARGRPLQSAKLSTDTLSALRSIGGLVPSPAKVDRQLRLLPEFSTALSEDEEAASGVWIRQATFMNPVK